MKIYNNMKCEIKYKIYKMTQIFEKYYEKRNKFLIEFYFSNNIKKKFI